MTDQVKTISVGGRIVKIQDADQGQLYGFYKKCITDGETLLWDQTYASLTEDQKRLVHERVQEGHFAEMRDQEQAAERATTNVHKAIAALCACVFSGSRFCTSVFLALMGKEKINDLKRGSALHKVCLAFGTVRSGRQLYSHFKEWSEDVLTPKKLYELHRAIESSYIPEVVSSVGSYIDRKQYDQIPGFARSESGGMPDEYSKLIRVTETHSANDNARIEALTGFAMDKLPSFKTSKDIDAFIALHEVKKDENQGTTLEAAFKAKGPSEQDIAIEALSKVGEVDLRQLIDLYEESVKAQVPFDQFVAIGYATIENLKQEMLDAISADSEVEPEAEPVAESA